jgi:hypothetical protein
MPKDYTRITKDENGGEVYHVPSGTPKQEMEKARKQERKDKNDPSYSLDDARKDSINNEKARKKLMGFDTTEPDEEDQDNMDASKHAKPRSYL